jgi:hypothetical protein
MLRDIDASVFRGVDRFDPGDLWKLAIDVTRDREYEDGEDGPAPQAARLPPRAHALDPTILLGSDGRMEVFSAPQAGGRTTMVPMPSGALPCLIRC